MGKPHLEEEDEESSMQESLQNMIKQDEDEFEIFFDQEQIQKTFDMQKKDMFQGLIEDKKLHKHNYSQNLIDIQEFAPKPEIKKSEGILKKKSLRGTRRMGINIDGEECEDDPKSVLLRKKLREFQERKERERKLKQEIAAI